MKLLFPAICLASFMLLTACATTGESASNMQENNSYNYHQNNASTTAAKMIAPATY